VEGHARKPHAIEPSLEDRWHPVPPRWEAQNEDFRRTEAFHVSFDTSSIGTRPIVHLSFRERHCGIETLSMEVKTINLMAARPETLDDLPISGPPVKLSGLGWA
jgi:hypothetical protein